MSYWTKRRKISKGVAEHYQAVSEYVETQQEHSVCNDLGTSHDANCLNPSEIREEFDNTNLMNYPSSSSEDESNCSKFEYVEAQEETIEMVESDDSSRPETDCIRNELREWALSYQIPHNAVSALLRLLKDKFPTLPKDARTLLHTPRNYDIKKIAGGQYHHFGLAQCILEKLSGTSVAEINSVSFQINIDGLPVYKCSSMQFWPILGRLTMPYVKGPFVIGIFYGQSKPTNVDEYLEEFVCEMEQLEHEGLIYQGKNISVKLSCVICDTPARAFVKKVKSHNGYSGCDKCCQSGVWDGRMTFPEINVSLRSDVAFDELRDEEHHQSGRSPFNRLSLGMVTQFPLDYMHLVCLGVMKKLINLWIRGPISTGCRIGSNALKLLSEKLVLYRRFIPREFSRKGREVSEIDRWKATEFRLFLLYTGPVALKGIINSKLYMNFLLFFVGISCLSNSSLTEDFCEYANKILCLFVKNFSDLYGSQMIVYNVHGLTHLAADVKKFGPVDNFSAFPFESFLGHLKKLLRTPNNPLQQVIRRVSEKQFAMSDFGYSSLKVCQLRYKHNDGPLPQGLRVLCQYREAQLDGFWVSSDTGNDCVKIKNDVVIIRNFFDRVDFGKGVIFEKFQKKEDFFTYPLPSSNLGIHRVSQLRGRLNIAHLSDISQKEMYCVVIFTDTDEVELVPKCWLKDDDQCLWPKYKSIDRLKRAVKSQEVPDPASWDLFKARIVYESKSYEAARIKLPLAEATSDLYTEDEETPVRKKKPTCRYQPDSDDVVNTNGTMPSLKKARVCQSLEVEAVPLFRPITPPPPPPSSAAAISPQSVRPRPISSSPLRRSPRRPSTSIHSSPVLPLISSRNSISMATLSGHIHQLIKAVEKNTQKTEENTQLLHQIIRQMPGCASASSQEHIQFPITSLESLQDAEMQLTDARKFKDVIHSLGVIGGVSIPETTRRILTKAISHGMATKINWKGTNNKTSFKSLKLKDVIIGATRRNPLASKCTDAEIEGVIKIWFRNASDRCGGKKEREARNERRRTEDADHA